MEIGSLVRRLKCNSIGKIIFIADQKIRVEAINQPKTIWRLQSKNNYVLLSDENKNVKPSSICTRAQYRKKLEEIGITLEKDRDVLHIISKANGGADHIDNYLFVGNMRLNRRLGKNADEIYCYLCGLEGTKRAVAASVKYGTFADHFISPHILYERGLARFNKILE
jgi:hypothetical protein